MAFLVNDGDDFDMDGCTNLLEFGSDEVSGGQRNPLDFWDFYDTWTRDITGQYHRDGAVGANDISEVSSRFLTTGSDTDIEDALTPPTSAGTYHASYDRGGSAAARLEPGACERQHQLRRRRRCCRPVPSFLLASPVAARATMSAP